MEAHPTCLMDPSPRRAENIHALHAGWDACRKQEPFDGTQSAAWRMGYLWRRDLELDKGIALLCRTHRLMASVP